MAMETVDECTDKLPFILNWEDTREVSFDTTVHFGKGTCFDGWDYLRMESETPIGRFAIWQEMDRNPTWSAYGGDLGYMAWHSFKSEEQAVKWVQDIVNSRIA